MPKVADPAIEPRLLANLRERADPSGFVAFDRFMEVALYAPDAGFYTREESPLGPSGEFYTAAHVGPLFTVPLARHLLALGERLVPRAELRVVEVGPGDGQLAAGLLTELGRGSGRAVEYVLIERSDSLRRAASARLEPIARESHVTVRTAGSVSELGPFDGLVIANELLDAMPARRVRWTADGWEELGVRVEGDRLEAAEGPFAGEPSLALPTPPRVGTVLEFSPAAEAFVRELADHLVHGAAVLMDYGMDESELLAGHPAGTLDAVRGHRAISDPLAAAGRTDLSVFVNFSRIRSVATRSGLTEGWFGSQAVALGEWGLPGVLRDAIARATGPEEEVRLRLAAKNLSFGFERFRVLELSPPGPTASAAGSM